MKLKRLFLQVLLIAYSISISTAHAEAAIVAQEPESALSDPVLLLQHTRTQIAFELAPKWMVRACNDVDYHHMWVFAQTSRPEGTYILASGSIWVSEDVAPGQPPVIDLQSDLTGEVDLIRKDRFCVVVCNPDVAFEGLVPDANFPLRPPHPPNATQAGIIHDLAVDLIRSELKIFGGREGFLKALAATDQGIPEEHPVMIPLVEALKANQQVR